MKKKFIYSGIFLLLAICQWGCDEYERTEVEKTISIDKSSVNIFIGEELQLTASPSENAPFTWSSKDTKVADVNNDGLIVGVGEGVTFIIVDDGTFQTKAEVTVNERIPLENLELEDDTLELSVNEDKTVSILLTPSNTNDAPDSTSWNSEDIKVAVVDAGGCITAIGEGETNVIYRAGKYKKIVKIYVANTWPFNGPHILSADDPCIVMVADFDIGGEGYGFHDSNASNSIGNDNYRKNGGDSNSYAVEVEGDDGKDIGYTGTGEWLVYTVVVNDAGEYMIELSESAAGASGAFHIEVDGVNISGTISVPNNGSWSSWRWLETSPPVTSMLTEGRHQIKFYFEGSGYNIRALRFTKL